MCSGLGKVVKYGLTYAVEVPALAAVRTQINVYAAEKNGHGVQGYKADSRSKPQLHPQNVEVVHCILPFEGRFGHNYPGCEDGGRVTHLLATNRIGVGRLKMTL